MRDYNEATTQVPHHSPVEVRYPRLEAGRVRPQVSGGRGCLGRLDSSADRRNGACASRCAS